MSSRLLGEKVEKIRDELVVEEFEREKLMAIKGETSHENDELFKRSVLAITSSSQASSQIHEHILAEGVTCITIKPLGGLLHLVTFASLEDKQAILKSHWLDTWFTELKEIEEDNSSKWKETWIRIYGVPLKSWSYENFFNIGCVFGRVLSIEYSNFDCAKVLLLTDCLFNINCSMIFDVNGKKSKIFISEDLRVVVQNRIPVENPMSWMSSDDDSDAGNEFAGSVHSHS